MTEEEHFEKCPFRAKGYNWMGKLVDGCTRYNDGTIVACYRACKYMTEFYEQQQNGRSKSSRH